MADDLKVDYEEIPQKGRNSFVRDFVNFMDRRSRLHLIVGWLNEKGKLQINAVLKHKGPIQVIEE